MIKIGDKVRVKDIEDLTLESDNSEVAIFKDSWDYKVLC